MYFEKVNIIGVIRAFSIEVSISTDASSVYDQLRQMADKWSTAGTKRLGTMERHAPYVLLRNATDSTLADIKTKLFDAGIDFVDGYPYKGSKFQIDHLNTPQTQERRIALRISESWDQTIRAIRALEPV